MRDRFQQFNRIANTEYSDLPDCYISVTVLLEYLDLFSYARTWASIPATPLSAWYYLSVLPLLKLQKLTTLLASLVVNLGLSCFTLSMPLSSSRPSGRAASLSQTLAFYVV